MDQRISRDDLEGAVVVVKRGDTELHRHLSGTYRGDTVVPLASASKWLTAATVMSLVDEGRLTLDAPVSAYAPALEGAVGAVTMRQLLSHTHGLGSAPSCMLVPAAPADVARCDLSTAFVKAQDPPGTQFTYSPTGPTIAGRVVELLTGTSFEDAFQQRIAKPLGMDHTSFTRTPDGETAGGGPDPAAGAVSSADEYLRFVQMLASDGNLHETTVLSPASAEAMLRLETADARFKADPTAADLDSIGYGLGAWVEAATPDGAATLIDSSGAYGTYPWIDRVRGVYGIVLVYDAANPGARGAVAESHDDVVAIGRTLDELAAAPDTSSS